MFGFQSRMRTAVENIGLIFMDLRETWIMFRVRSVSNIVVFNEEFITP